MKKSLILALAALGFAANAAQVENVDSLLDARPGSRSAQRSELLQATKLIYVNGQGQTPPAADSAQSLLQQFYEDQFRQFHDPEAPTFMFMTHDANLAMGIGGKVMMRGWFDWNGAQDGYEFFPYDIAIPKNPTERRSLGASASQSSVFMTLLGRNNSMRYMVYVQGGVKKNAFVLKKAYVKVNDFTVGLAPTTFEDGDALVPTVDAQGPNGQTGKSQMLARYLHEFKNGVSVGAGFEFPSSSQDAIEGQTEKCRDYLPDVAALLQYSWDGGDSHVRLSGILRNMAYRDLLTGKNHNVIGWGAQISGLANIGGPVTVYFSSVVGRGVGSYMGDLSEGNYDLVGVSNRPGKMEAPLSLGLTAGLQYNFSRRVFACVGFGETRYLQKHRLTDDQYKYGLYGAANLFWKITPRFTTGVEYVVGKRMNFDRAHGAGNRVDALLAFSF